MPINIRPKGSPRNTQYLGSVEWADSPNHTRFDSYYLNPRGAYWLLWIGYQDENTWNWKWTWNLYAYCKKRGYVEKQELDVEVEVDRNFTVEFIMP
jgi:hypothetical protein